MRVGQEVQALPRRLSRERSLAVAVVLFFALFALLAASFEGPVGDLDEQVARWVASDLPVWAEWLARPFSWLGGWIGLTLLAVAVGGTLVRVRAGVDLVFFFAALLGSQLVVALVKEGFGRARPDLGSAVPLPGSFAFPSGHATAGAAALGAAAVLVAERLPSGRARLVVWTAAVVLGAGVGLSRIALNVHYVSDVLAGWCLGLAWLAVCLLVRDRRRARTPGASDEAVPGV